MSMYDTEWCKHLLKRLNQYKDLLARMEILETMIEKSAYPSNNMVANYSEAPTQPMINLGTFSKNEIEHTNLRFEKQLIDGALKCLETMDKDIICLSYIEKVNAWHITDIFIPKNYNDNKGRPLYISKRNLIRRRTASLKRMASHLGYFSTPSKDFLPKFIEGDFLRVEDKQIL